MQLNIGLGIGGALGASVGDVPGGPTTMTVAIADAPDPVNGGTNITYTVTPTVTGANGVTDLVATVTLDASLTYASSSGTGWVITQVGRVVTAQIAFFPVGSSSTFSVVATTTNADSTAVTSLSAIGSNAPVVTSSASTTVQHVASGDGPGGTVLTPLAAAAFAAVTGRTPTHSYSCQEASGNLLDQIGSLNMTAAGTPLYSQAVTGWTRVGVGFNQTANQAFTVATGNGPNPTATPVAYLIYVTVRTPAALRGVVFCGDAGASNRGAILTNTNGNWRSQCGASTNDGAVDHRDTNVHPLLLTYDPGTTTVNRYTDLEKDLGPTAAGVVDARKGIGAFNGGSSHLGEILYFVILQGTDAQFTDAQAKSMLQALGWTVTAWS